MAQTIKIKRSSTNNAPTTLNQGELAYSHGGTGNQGVLYMGRPGTGDVDAIGGKYYVDYVENLDTSQVSEATGSLYFTNERVDDRVNSLLVGGTGITLNYDDAANSLTINGLAQYGDSDVRDFLESSSNSIEAKLDKLTLTGDLLAPADFTIDPSGHGDNTGQVTIAGDLVVTGTTTTIDSNVISLGDRIVRLAQEYGDTNPPPSTLVAGLEINRGNAPYDAYVLYREGNTSGKRWVVSEGGPVDYPVLTTNNFESGYTGNIDGGTF